MSKIVAAEKISTLLDPDTELLKSISILSQEITANTEVELHRHSWGQLNVSDGGVMEITIENQRVLTAPWQFAVWIPAGVSHCSFNRKNIDYCSVSFPAAIALKLPSQACVLPLSGIVREIIRDLRQRQIKQLTRPQDLTLGQVLVDQLLQQTPSGTWLPTTDDRLIKPVIDGLRQNPGDTRSLAQWGKLVYASEKTLSRRFVQLMNISFREWRGRLRFLTSLSMLKNAISVQEIAYTLGYSNPSSFIAMFHKATGMTPEKYRKECL